MKLVSDVLLLIFPLIIAVSPSVRALYLKEDSDLSLFKRKGKDGDKSSGKSYSSGRFDYSIFHFKKLLKPRLPRKKPHRPHQKIKPCDKIEPLKTIDSKPEKQTTYIKAIPTETPSETETPETPTETETPTPIEVGITPYASSNLAVIQTTLLVETPTPIITAIPTSSPSNTDLYPSLPVDTATPSADGPFVLHIPTHTPELEAPTDDDFSGASILSLEIVLAASLIIVLF